MGLLELCLGFQSFILFSKESGAVVEMHTLSSHLGLSLSPGLLHFQILNACTASDQELGGEELRPGNKATLYQECLHSVTCDLL